LALAVVSAPLPALARDEAPPLQRVDPQLFGLLGYREASNGFLGLWPSRSKLFRLQGDDKKVFRGLGQENDVADFFFPTLTVRAPLRRVLYVVPEAKRQLTEFEKSVATANALSLGGSALWWGGALSVPLAILVSVNGGGNNAGPASLLWFGAIGGIAAGSALADGIAPMAMSRSYFHLNEAVASFNAAYGYNRD
jgi:hypothetical protein